ncbi:MAG: uL11 family ribosomal protein [Cytophagales bacterium]
MSNNKPLKLELKGGMVTPAAIATALGSRGVNTRDFVLQCNAMTEKMKGELLRIWVYISPDKKFKIEVKGQPTSALIKDALKIDKGSGEPNRNKVGKLDLAAVDKIIEKGGATIRGFSKEAKQKVVAGIARSMGVDIIK